MKKLPAELIRNQFEIDGHHLIFHCCGKILAVLANESDDLHSIIACPFCGEKITEERSTIE